MTGKTFHLNLTEIPLAQLLINELQPKINKQKRPECTGMQTLERLYNINYLGHLFKPGPDEGD